MTQQNQVKDKKDLNLQPGEIENVWIKREQKPYSRNEIIRTITAKLLEGDETDIKILYGFVRSMKGLYKNLPKEIDEHLNEFKRYSRMSGGKRTMEYVLEQKRTSLQNALEYVWGNIEYEPDDVEESVLVEGVDGRPEGYARYTKEFDIEKQVKEALKAKREAKLNANVEEEKKD